MYSISIFCETRRQFRS